MIELEKALSEEAFDRRDPEIREFQSNVKDLCFEFNQNNQGCPHSSTKDKDNRKATGRTDKG